MEILFENADSGSDSWEVFKKLNSTRFSLLHRVFEPIKRKGDNSQLLLKIAVPLSIIAVTLLPLFVTAFLDLPTLTKPSENLQLPFLKDWNMILWFTFTFPLLTYFAVMDQSHLIDAVKNILSNNILSLPSEKGKSLIETWNSRFGNINIGAQLLGLISGLVAAWVNYFLWAYHPEIKFWILKDNKFSVTGFVYLFCIFMFFLTVTVYVVRSISISSFLNATLKDAQIRLVPFHPDGCLGLSKVGYLGLKNQYILSAIGINLFIFYYVNIRSLGNPPILNLLIMVLGILYIIIGPIVFFAPLLSFRDCMKKFKLELINDFTGKLQSEFKNIRHKLKSESILKEEGELIENLRNMGKLLGELPVWPFDTRTIRTFVYTYMAPLATSLVPLILKTFKDLYRLLGG